MPVFLQFVLTLCLTIGLPIYFIVCHRGRFFVFAASSLVFCLSVITIGLVLDFKEAFSQLTPYEAVGSAWFFDPLTTWQKFKSVFFTILAAFAAGQFVQSNTLKTWFDRRLRTTIRERIEAEVRSGCVQRLADVEKREQALRVREENLSVREKQTEELRAKVNNRIEELNQTYSDRFHDLESAVRDYHSNREQRRIADIELHEQLLSAVEKREDIKHVAARLIPYKMAWTELCSDCDGKTREALQQRLTGAKQKYRAESALRAQETRRKRRDVDTGEPAMPDLDRLQPQQVLPEPQA